MPRLSICEKLAEESRTLNGELAWWTAHRRTLSSQARQEIADADRTIELIGDEISANAQAQAENGCFRPPQKALLLHNYDAGGIQVSHSANVNQARAESDIAANPSNPLQLVGASKKFRNITDYDFWIAAYRSGDAGSTWNEIELPPPVSPDQFDPIIIISDPTVVWDDANRVYIACSAWGYLGSKPGDRIPEPEVSGGAGTGVGIVVYRSMDGGATWPDSVVLRSHPTVPLSDTTNNDDKMWPAFNPATRELVLAWGFDPMIIAKTKVDEWKWEVRGITSVKDGSLVNGRGVALAALKSGSLAIAWMFPKRNSVKFARSAYATGDPRWNVFTEPTDMASGFTDLGGFEEGYGGFFPLPGGTFRSESFVAMAAEDEFLFAAWPSKESDNSATIRYAYSTDGGVNWQGPTDGQILIPPNEGKLRFQPQVALGGEFDGVACTYYELDSATGKIHVCVSAALHPGGTWQTVRVTDTPWDPRVDAIPQHGVDSHGLTFIGDYYGLASCRLGFFPLWMDTRTGIAEMFTARVDFHRVITSPSQPGHPIFPHNR